MRRNIYTRKNITNLIKIPWIYYNENLWLISYSVDWQNWITIADKNLWATQVYNYWDVMTEANCWKYYQWWNNYGFAFSGATQTDSNSIDASNYWPWNYYSSDVFITTNPRDNSDNHNIWGWISGLVTDRQGPCPEWWHIPRFTEWKDIVDYWWNNWIWTNDADAFTSVLKIPQSWVLDPSNGQPNLTGSSWYYWTATRQSVGYTYSLIFYANYISPHDNIWGSDPQNYGFPIRPFKDIPVQPDITRTILHQSN